MASFPLFSIYLGVHMSPVMLKINKFTTGFGSLDVGNVQ